MAKKIVTLMTCFNRKEKTLKTIQKINKEVKNMHFVVVDDNSTDGTYEELLNLKTKIQNMTVISGTGSLFYSGGMRVGMEYLLKQNQKFDYLLIVNDDVDFEKGFLDKMIYFSNKRNSVVVGPTYNSEKKLSYGGIKYVTKSKIKVLGPDSNTECDTFNANCVLIPYEWFKECGPYDSVYTHSMADFDYGFMIRKNKHKIYVLDSYIGECNRNTIKNTWRDKSLKIAQRIKKKESPKGLPFKENFHYFKKNFGICYAIIKSITPYIRIFMRK